jgi:hypothetical protein
MSTTNAVPKWNGTQLVDGSISDNGTTVSVGSSSNFSVDVSSGNTTTNGNLTVNGNTTLGNTALLGRLVLEIKTPLVHHMVYNSCLILIITQMTQEL